MIMVYVLTHSPCSFLTYFSFLEAHNDGMYTVVQTLGAVPEQSRGKERHCCCWLYISLPDKLKAKPGRAFSEHFLSEKLDNWFPFIFHEPNDSWKGKVGTLLFLLFWVATCWWQGLPSSSKIEKTLKLLLTHTHTPPPTPSGNPESAKTVFCILSIRQNSQ